MHEERHTVTTLPPKPPGKPQEPNAPESLEVGPQQQVVREAPYNQAKYHDDVRKVTTYALLGLIGATVLASFYVLVWQHSVWPDAKDWLQALLPAETALLGSAIGFYFGSKHGPSDR
jgi:hypothetical protein